MYILSLCMYDMRSCKCVCVCVLTCLEARVSLTGGSPGLVKSQQHIGTCAQAIASAKSASQNKDPKTNRLEHPEHFEAPSSNQTWLAGKYTIHCRWGFLARKTTDEWSLFQPSMVCVVWTLGTQEKTPCSRGCGCHRWCDRGLRRQVRGYARLGAEMVDPKINNSSRISNH